MKFYNKLPNDLKTIDGFQHLKGKLFSLFVGTLYHKLYLEQ